MKWPWVKRSRLDKVMATNELWFNLYQRTNRKYLELSLKIIKKGVKL